MVPGWIATVINVEGAFLHGKFTNGKIIYAEVPDGVEKYYGRHEDVVLLLNVPMYRTKQAAQCFWNERLRTIWKISKVHG